MLTRAYIWTKNGVLIFHPGKHAMVRLPSCSSFPRWMQEFVKGKALRCYEGVGVCSLAHYSLVFIHPLNSCCPVELEGAMRSFRLKVGPMLERAAIWKKSLQIIVAPPGAGIDRFEDVPEGLLVSTDALTERWSTWVSLRCAWVLTKSSKLPDIERIHLCLYLLEGFDSGQINEYLEKLRLKATGRLECPSDKPWKCDHCLTLFGDGDGERMKRLDLKPLEAEEGDRP